LDGTTLASTLTAATAQLICCSVLAQPQLLLGHKLLQVALALTWHAVNAKHFITGQMQCAKQAFAVTACRAPDASEAAPAKETRTNICCLLSSCLM
jgi:hypothetical protein